MIGKDNNGKNIDQAFEVYEKIRESLYGLNEILKINFNENDFYFQAGMDNLEALNENIVEILKSTYTPREVRIKMREIEDLEHLKNISI